MRPRANNLVPSFVCNSSPVASPGQSRLTRKIRMGEACSCNHKKVNHKEHDSRLCRHKSTFFSSDHLFVDSTKDQHPSCTPKDCSLDPLMIKASPLQPWCLYTSPYRSLILTHSLCLLCIPIPHPNHHPL